MNITLKPQVKTFALQSLFLQGEAKSQEIAFVIPEAYAALPTWQMRGYFEAYGEGAYQDLSPVTADGVTTVTWKPPASFTNRDGLITLMLVGSNANAETVVKWTTRLNIPVDPTITNPTPTQVSIIEQLIAQATAVISAANSAAGTANTAASSANTAADEANSAAALANEATETANSAEQIRSENEQTRQTQEAAREQAETERAAQFDTVLTAAQGYATSASGSASAASTSAGAAATSETNASASATSAGESAASATSSAVSALDSKQQAQAAYAAVVAADIGVLESGLVNAHSVYSPLLDSSGNNILDNSGNNLEARTIFADAADILALLARINALEAIAKIC